MSVYLVAAAKASCPVAGCRCWDRTACYPSDMTDPEWEVLEPEAEAVMAELRRGPGGRPMSHDLRAVVDAIGYVTKYGVEWRALPVDFPPWDAVYAFFERWSARGLPDRLTWLLAVAMIAVSRPPLRRATPAVRRRPRGGRQARGHGGRRVRRRARRAATRRRPGQRAPASGTAW